MEKKQNTCVWVLTVLLVLSVAFNIWMVSKSSNKTGSVEEMTGTPSNSGTVTLTWSCDDEYCKESGGYAYIYDANWEYLNTGRYTGGGSYSFSLDNPSLVKQIAIGRCATGELNMVLNPGSSYNIDWGC